MRIAVVAGFLCVVFSGAVAQAREPNIPWQTYRNAQFGTEVTLPQSWRFKEDVNNGAGATYTSPNGQGNAIIFASSARNTDVTTLLSADRGERVTYRFNKGNVVVMSGFHGDKIFYRKHVLGCNGRMWNHLVVTYPAQAKKLFDPVLNKMVFSLQAGQGSFCRR